MQAMIKIEGNRCQSCGTSIGQIIEFGTYRDGSVNTDYCVHCFEEGKFIRKNISLEQKFALNMELAAKLEKARSRAIKELNLVLPNLKRWRKSKKRKERDRMDKNL